MKLCAIDGCGGKRYARGLCGKHHVRWKKHGDPLAGRTPNGDGLKFLQDNKDYVGDGCIFWPYGNGKDGRGHVYINKRRVRAHVAMLEITAGPKPSPEHECAHSCGQGHKGCVAPNHLRWATRSENIRDRIEHGTSNRGERCAKAKITEAQVREIRELIKAGISQSEIAKLYCISQTNVSYIKNRVNWAWLENKAVAP